MDPVALRYEEVARLRPVALVSAVDRPLQVTDPGPASSTPLPRPAPYVGIEAVLPPGSPAAPGDATVSGPLGATGRLALTLTGQGLVLRAVLEAGEARLELDGPGGTRVLRSRRSGRVTGPVDALGLVLAGTHVVALTRADGRWTGRARTDLLEAEPDYAVALTALDAASAVIVDRAGATEEQFLASVRNLQAARAVEMQRQVRTGQRGKS